MKMKVILAVCLFCSFFSRAQDFHFSQFSETPLLLNPALTGSFDGSLRATVYFRNQWKKIINPYETFGASLDYRMEDRRNRNGYLAFGVSLMKDKAGKSELATTQGLVSLAYHLKIEKHSFLTAGIQGGFTQKRVNYDGLLWDNQYDASYQGFNPNLPTKENSLSDGFSYNDVSGGILYSLSTYEIQAPAIQSISLKTGFSFYHFVKTDKSFTEIYNNPMYPKFVYHLKSNVGVFRSGFSIVPVFMAEFQGPHREYVAGTSLRYALRKKTGMKKDIEEKALSLGYLVRMGDAFIPYMAIEFMGFKLGLTYDASFSDIKKFTKRVGGFELNLQFSN